MTANDIKRILGTVGVDQKHMFHGIYMASVVNVNDPLGEGRVTLKIPQVLGTATSNWADPLGFQPSDVPPPGTIVHAYFTGGDVNFPIYASLNLATVNSEIAALQSQVNALAAFPGAWNAVSLSNSWSNAPTYLPAQVRKVSSGSAQLVGIIQSGSTLDGTVIGTLPAGFINSSSNQIFNCSVVSGGDADPSNGFISGSVDTSGLSDGTINGVSNNTGLPDGTTTGTSGSANATSPHTHGPGSYSVTNGNHNHASGSFAVANGNHVHTTSGLLSTASVNNNSPLILVDMAGDLIIFNCSSNSSQLSINANLVI